MGTRRPALDPDAPARTEVLHASERTRVARLFLPGRTVIRKEPLGADAQRRLQHELAMLERLRGAMGIAQLADAPPYAGSIVLVDAGGASAVELPKPLAVDDLRRACGGHGPGSRGDAPPGCHAPRHRAGEHRDLPRGGSMPGGLRSWRPCWPRCVPTSPTTARSSGRWPIWRRSRPDGPVGRWMSAPTCTRWARRCTSSPPGSRRSAPAIRCASSTITSRACRCRRHR